MPQVRLDRWLAEVSGASRAEVDRLIRAGRVALEGQTVREPGRRLLPPPAGPAVTLDGQVVEAPPPVLVGHKPLGVQCVVGDPWGRPDLRSWVGPWLDKGFHPVGRLDADTSGLLLLSRVGGLTQALLHPKRQVGRAYRATVDVALTAQALEGLRSRLAEGVETSDGVYRAVVLGAGPDWLDVEVTEGRYRMVRRMLHNAGASVLALHRWRYGPVELGALEPGAIRPIAAAEWAALPGVERFSGRAAPG